MWPASGLFIVTLLMAPVGLAQTTLPCPSTAPAVPFSARVADIPAGFDFPTAPNKLTSPKDACSLSELRKHSWMVWAGMTQPAADGPVWTTWPNAEQVFQTNISLFFPSKGVRGLSDPLQFNPGILIGGGREDDVTKSRPDSLSQSSSPYSCRVTPLVSVLFNKEAASHIRFRSLYRKETLDGFWNCKMQVPQFAPEAVAVKAMWWPVKNYPANQPHGRTLSVVPVWDNDPRFPEDTGISLQNIDCGNGPLTWKRLVAVDPHPEQMKDYETASVQFIDPNDMISKIDVPSVPVVSIASFYSVTVSDVDISPDARVRLNSLVSYFWCNGQTVEDSDKLILVGLHFATRETPDWFWTTLWWHDQPDQGPFSQDRPAALRGVWRNYLMDCAVDADKIVYNPWLEARFSYGTKSNCMSCHQRAARPEGATPAEPSNTLRRKLAEEDVYFTDKLRTRFLWSIPDRAK